MKTSIHLIALFAILGSAGNSLAGEPKGPRLGFDVAGLEARMDEPDRMTTGSIQNSQTFSVVFLNDLVPDDPARRTVEQNANNPIHRAAARAFVNADPALMNELRAQNLDTRNVVGVLKDADGRNVIYVK